MSYVVPEDTRCQYFASCDICWTSVLLSTFASLHTNIKHSYKLVVPLVESALALLAAYALYRHNIVKVHSLDQLLNDIYLMLSGGTILISHGIRLSSRYVLCPAIFEEHYYLLVDEYIEWWDNKLCRRFNFGVAKDEPCLGSLEGLCETLTDYVFCAMINCLVVLLFAVTSLLGLAFYILYVNILHIWPALLLLVFLLYPFLFIPDLLIGVLYHLQSESGNFCLLFLSHLFKHLDFILYYMYDFRYDIVGWLGDRKRYRNLFKMFLFLCMWVTVGPRAFVYLNNDSSLGEAVDHKDTEQGCVVSLSRTQFRIFAYDAFMTYSGFAFIFLTIGWTHFRLFCFILLVFSFISELYVYLVFTSCSPYTLGGKNRILPTNDEDCLSITENNLKPSKAERINVSINDLGY